MTIPISTPCLFGTRAIQQIVAPLFEATGLNFFSYARDFNEKKSFSMQSNNELYYAWYESKSPYCSSVTPDGVYSSEVIQNSVLQENASKLNYGNGIYFFKRYNSFSEIISLAAPPKSINVLQFYVNNSHLINKFILYFKAQAAEIINEAMNNPIVVPDDMIDTQKTFPGLKPNNNVLLDNIKVDKFYIDDKTEVKLSKREIECLAHYIKGLSTSQIAEIMQVKKVTADTFMKNIKTKFRCASKSELFEKLWDMGLLQSNGMF